MKINIGKIFINLLVGIIVAIASDFIIEKIHTKITQPEKHGEKKSYPPKSDDFTNIESKKEPIDIKMVSNDLSSPISNENTNPVLKEDFINNEISLVGYWEAKIDKYNSTKSSLDFKSNGSLIVKVINADNQEFTQKRYWKYSTYTLIQINELDKVIEKDRIAWDGENRFTLTVFEEKSGRVGEQFVYIKKKP